MPGVKPLCWVDGRLRPIADAAIRVDDLAYTEGRGCYTTARIRAGRARFAERHLRRLERGAEALALGKVDARAVAHCVQDLAAAVFPDGDGIIRIQLSRDAAGATHIVGVPRALGQVASTWTAITAPLQHQGPIVAGGHKLTNRVVIALAADARAAAGVDEALLYDAAGRLVEGTRSNIVLVSSEGDLVTPPVSRGLVAGIAREVARDRVPELRERDLQRSDIESAREIVAINCVRGACPIVRLDGQTLGAQKGPGLDRLRRALEDD
jgi:branched-subunit amino acid aminotransferase/4-amino-4-deoxychorismate lyase